MIAQMSVDADAARLLTWNAADLLEASRPFGDRGVDSGDSWSASEAAVRATNPGRCRSSAATGVIARVPGREVPPRRPGDDALRGHLADPEAAHRPRRDRHQCLRLTSCSRLDPGIDHDCCFRVRGGAYAVRPVRRRARRGAPRRPGCDRDQGRAREGARPRPGRDRRRGLWGCANQAGEDNRNVGRMAVLLAGLPVSVPASTVNRLCGSSLDAAMIGSRVIESGDADVVLTGGVESMTGRHGCCRSRRAPSRRHADPVSTPTLGWRLVNENMPAEWTVSLGEANELLGERFAISRNRQDEFAARSHQLADAAWTAGFYDDLVVPVADLTRDESIRPGSTADKLAGPQAVVPSRRHDHRGQRIPAQRRGFRRPARFGERPIGIDPIARIAGRGVVRRRSPRCSGSRRWRPRPGAGPGRHHLGRRVGRRGATRRSRCSRSRASTPGPRVGSATRRSVSQGWRDRDRPPARRVRRPDPRHPGRAAGRVR